MLDARKGHGVFNKNPNARTEPRKPRRQMNGTMASVAVLLATGEVRAEQIPAALTEAMTQLADGNLKLRDRTVRPLADAADVHAQLEAGTLRSKAILAV